MISMNICKPTRRSQAGPLLEGPAPLALVLPKSHGFQKKKKKQTQQESCYKTDWIS